MLLSGNDFSTVGFAGGNSNREAIDGFSAIAAALDQGIDPAHRAGGKILDMIAIGLGWAVLAAVIFFPALQLAAIGICVAFMFVRSFGRLILGVPGQSLEWTRQAMLSEGSLLAA